MAANLLLILIPCFVAGTLGLVNRNQAGDDFQNFNPQFVAPMLTPKQFLIISSPTQRKVVYTPLRNFKSVTGRTFALIDSGLTRPKGIAFDGERGALYVADEGAAKLYRYRIYVQDDSSLVCDGVRITILQDVPVTWVAVEHTGNVVYSDPTTGSVNKIPYSTILHLAQGNFQARDMQFRQDSETLRRQQDLNRDLDQPATAAFVYRLYESFLTPSVSVPTGVAADGYSVYWGNGDNGTQAGSIVRGRSAQLRDWEQADSPTLSAMPLTSVVEQTFGVVKTTSMVLFSSNHSGIGAVYGVLEKSGQTHVFSSDLGEPRGLVWDGDNTVYVADSAMDGVWSLPVGRPVDGTPITKAAVLKGAFGVALLSAEDAAWGVRSATAIQAKWLAWLLAAVTAGLAL